MGSWSARKLFLTPQAMGSASLFSCKPANTSGRLKRRSMDWPIVGWGPSPACTSHPTSMRSAHTLSDWRSEGKTWELPKVFQAYVVSWMLSSLIGFSWLMSFQVSCLGPGAEAGKCCIDCNGVLNEYPDIKALSKVSPCSALLYRIFVKVVKVI